MGKTVRDLLEARVGAGLTPRASTVQVAVAAAQLLRQVPARVAVLIVNIGPFTMFVGPAGIVLGSPGLGIRLEPNGGAVTAQWDEDGEVVAWEWNAISIGGANTAYVLETVIERPTPEAEP